LSRVLADNWSLQSIGELITNGLGNDTASTIEICKAKDTHEYKSIEYDIIRIEALFDFLNDVVLRDEVIVDESYIGTWAKPESPLVGLHEAGIICPFPFLATPERLKAPTEALVKRLCATSTLENEHAKNNSMWALERRTPYPALSSTLWGGAGMLARSHIYECNYTPHPLRKRFFLNAGVFLGKTDASNQLKNLIHKKRVQLFAKSNGENGLYTAFLQLPPIPFRIIEESSDIHDIFRIAIEMRSQLQGLRQWLNQFQNAIDNEDVTSMLKHEELLSSVSRYADQIISGNSAGRVDMSLNLGLLKFSLKGDPVNLLQNQFGVRSTINSLIFDKPGRQALKKLLKFLGDADTSSGYKIFEHFASTSALP